MRAESLEFADGAFDRVESFHVLEHVDDFGAALSEMARVLKPGGTLVAEVPAPALERKLLALDPGYHKKAGHKRVVTPELMAEGARSCGLELKRRVNVDGVLGWWVVNSYRSGRFIQSDVGEIPGSSATVLKLLRYFSPKIFRHRKLRWIPLWIIGIPLGWAINLIVPFAHRYRLKKLKA